MEEGGCGFEWRRGEGGAEDDEVDIAAMEERSALHWSRRGERTHPPGRYRPVPTLPKHSTSASLHRLLIVRRISSTVHNRSSCSIGVGEM